MCYRKVASKIVAESARTLTRLRTPLKSTEIELLRSTVSIGVRGISSMALDSCHVTSALGVQSLVTTPCYYPIIVAASSANKGSKLSLSRPSLCVNSRFLVFTLKYVIQQTTNKLTNIKRIHNTRTYRVTSYQGRFQYPASMLPTQ